jgi:hypothetical protein
MALSANRDTLRREGDVESHPVKAATKVYGGGLTCIDANGWAVPGSTSTTLKAIGRAECAADNSSGANGDIRVNTRRGTFRFKNSASTDQITRADISNSAYIVDDETVAKTNGSSSRSVAGTIRDVDAQGVWVQI